MWPLPFSIYYELASGHIQELKREAEDDRLAALARHRELSAAQSGRNPVRSVAARAFRGLSDASHAVSEAACTAATRLEGKVA